MKWLIGVDLEEKATGALHFAFVEREAERLEEMQCGARGETRSAHVSGIPVNLRMYEDDVGCPFHFVKL